ncbi:hypothetical protein BKA56DRAFT_616091 [Ilyonectria sp. MPI-CAGE-AT-0026]|nr:hypothetical protein BKA56DRAFT_616091 [Ilyonectria sp. MPI-CAGE-AT-0026]
MQPDEDSAGAECGSSGISPFPSRLLLVHARLVHCLLLPPPYVHFARWKPNARRFDQPTTNREGGRRHAGPDPGIPPKAQLQVVDGHFRESMKQSMEGFQKQWGWPKGSVGKCHLRAALCWMRRRVAGMSWARGCHEGSMPVCTFASVAITSSPQLPGYDARNKEHSK